MQIFYGEYPQERNTAVALGNFDGVHVGHTRLINKLIKTEYKKVVYTFFEHPINVIKGDNAVRFLNTNSEKAVLFEELGVDILLLDDFNAVRDMSPVEFVKDILVKKLHARAVFCGYNYRFGKDNVGNVNVLKKLLADEGIELIVLKEVSIGGKAVSSSRIRDALILGEMEEVQSLLGRPYFVIGKVLHGKALGRQLGFPTINIDFDKGRELPKNGVYFAKCSFDGKEYPVAASVGVRPTVETGILKPRLEAHIIDFDKDLYGEEIKVEFIKKIRDEIKFSSLDDLKKQVALDIEQCKTSFSER